MDKENLSLIINGFVAIGSMIMGSVFTILSIKYTADREDRRKQEEVNRTAANERLKMLYEPLYNRLSESFEDGVYYDRELWTNITDIVDNNFLYASHDLIKIFFKVRANIKQVNNNDDNSYNLAKSFFKLVVSEYVSLKTFLGYGQILKKPSIIKKIKDELSNKIKSCKTLY